MTTTKQAERKPRFKRAKVRPFAVQERDLDIIKQVYKHRFLTSEHIAALIDGSGQGILRRLQLLYHAGYLDRPREQIKPYHAGSTAMVYGIGNKGADYLSQALNVPRSKVDWTSKNREAKTVFLEHTLEIANFMVCLELACRQTKNVQLIGPAEILRPTAKHKKENALAWAVGKIIKDEKTGDRKHYNFSLVPDKLFGLHFPEDPPDRNKAFFFLEVDRSTMPINRSNLFRTSFAKKLSLYWESWQQGLFEQNFHFKNARVLTLAKSPARIVSMIEAVKEADERKKGSRMFMFALDKFFDPAQPATALERIWQNGRDSELLSLVD
jgi:hypothetical protein